MKRQAITRHGNVHAWPTREAAFTAATEAAEDRPRSLLRFAAEAVPLPRVGGFEWTVLVYEGQHLEGWLVPVASQPHLTQPAQQKQHGA